MRRRRRIALAFGVVLLVLLLWLGWKSWRVLQLARSLQAYPAQAELLLTPGISNVDPDAAERLVLAMRQDVVDLSAELDLFLPLAPYFTWLPRVGPLLAEAEPLLTMADAGTEAAALLATSLKPALVILQSQGGDADSLLPQILPVLEEARPELEQASTALERVQAARSSIDNETELPWRVQTLLAQFDAQASLIDQFELLLVLPELLGLHGEKRYLIVAQNEDELRATGGFITGAGLLVLNQGRISELAFQDANTIDDWADKPYDFPPEPFYQLMGLELFLFRDANYWPDFPRSAEQAMALYEYGQDAPPLDGVVAIDQRFVADLVRVIGPIEVPELDLTLTGNNTIASLRRAWSPEDDEAVRDWIAGRKDFLSPLAQAMKEKIFADIESLDLPALLKMAQGSAAQKHIQVYFRDPEAQAVVEGLDWDGRVAGVADSDLLMVVDMNVGYNKVNAVVDSALIYRVALDRSGTGTAELTIEYVHNAATNTEPCSQLVDYHEVSTYEGLMERCFWDFLRIYVPPGSELEGGTEHDFPVGAFGFSEGWEGGPRRMDEDTDAVVFGNFLLLRPGTSLSSRYHYTLPQVASVVDDHRRYRLQILQQAGSPPRPLTVEIVLPSGASVIDANEPISQSGPSLFFETTLRQDSTFIVDYEVP